MRSGQVGSPPGATGTSPPGLSPPGLREVVWADLAAVARLKGCRFPSAVGLVDVLLIPGTWAVLLYRLACFFHEHHLRPFSRLLYFANVVLFSADLAPGSKVGPGLAVPHPVFTGWGSGLTMGSGCILTGGVRFGTAAAEDSARSGQPTVGDGVVFLDGAKVLGPVTIGDGAVVAANALVLHDVPPGAIVVGQPARVARYRSERGSAGATDPGEMLASAVADLARPAEPAQ